jgi:hypothetical protein
VDALFSVHFHLLAAGWNIVYSPKRFDSVFLRKESHPYGFGFARVGLSFSYFFFPQFSASAFFAPRSAPERRSRVRTFLMIPFFGFRISNFDFLVRFPKTAVYRIFTEPILTRAEACCMVSPKEAH